MWSDEWGPTLSSAEFAFALTVGTTGIVYVGGSTSDSSPGDAITVAYDAQGNLVGIDIDKASSKVELSQLVLDKLPSTVKTIAA